MPDKTIDRSFIDDAHDIQPRGQRGWFDSFSQPQAHDQGLMRSFLAG